MRHLLLFFMFFSLCAFSQENSLQDEQHYYVTEINTSEISETDSLFTEGQKITFFVALGVLLIAFIIAHIKARRGTMVVIAGWKDLTLLALPTILGILIALLFIVSRIAEDMGERELLSTELWRGILIFWLVASAISLIISFILSVIANRNNVFNIIISILAKVFVFTILMFLILGVLDYHLRENKKDRRFKDGTRGNNKTKWYLFIFAIASMLLIPLVKTDSTIFQEQHAKLKSRNVW